MKPLWKRPAKKKAKKKKPQSRPVGTPKPRPEPWVPPHPEALKQKPQNFSVSVEAAVSGENVLRGFADGMKSVSEKKPAGEISKNTFKSESAIRTEFLKARHQREHCPSGLERVSG